MRKGKEKLSPCAGKVGESMETSPCLSLLGLMVGSSFYPEGFYPAVRAVAKDEMIEGLRRGYLGNISINWHMLGLSVCISNPSIDLN